KTEPRAQRNRVDLIVRVRGNGPCANVIGPKAAKLKCELVVIVPVAGAAPQPRPDGFSLLATGSFAIERHVLIVQAHVIEVDVTIWQKAKWPDRIDGPETIRVIRWIIEKAC